MPSIKGNKSRCTPFAGHVAADTAVARANLVNFVEKNDAVVLNCLDRLLRQLIAVEQFVGFFIDQNFVGIGDVDAPRLGAPAAELAENIADRNGADLGARHARNLEQRHAAGGLHLDFDLLVVELAGAQLAAECFFGGGAGAGADQRIEDAAFGRLLRARLNVFSLSLPGQRDGNLDQIAHDLLDVAADIADFGEFRRFDLEKGCAGKLGQAARDFRFADAGRADHQNVLRQHLFAQPLFQLQSPPAVAQRNGDRPFGIALSDNEAVELGNNFTGRKITHVPHTISIARPSGVSTRRSSRKPAFL